MIDQPAHNGKDHDERGRFTAGNQIATANKGKRWTNRVKWWRKAYLECVTPEEFREIVMVLVEAAKEGQPWAVKEIMHRALGKPEQKIELDGDIPSQVNFILSLDTPGRPEREIIDEQPGALPDG